MKLSDWAKKEGISYLTAYRWWKVGKLPVDSYQSDSGTIIVQDNSETSEQAMSFSSKINNDAMSLFLKKTVEFSKNSNSIEDFAAYIISNFSIKLNNNYDSPKYSKNKPKSEEIQEHFKKYIPFQKEKPKPNMFIFTEGEQMLDELVDKVDDLTTQELVSEIRKYGNIESQHTNPLIGDVIISNSLQQPNFSNINSFDSSFSINAPNTSLKFLDTSGTIGYNGIFCSTQNAADISFEPIQKESSFDISKIIDKPKRGRPRKKIL